MANTTATKSTVSKKAKTRAVIGGGIPPVTPQQRYRMISEAAYFRAEKRGFVGGDTAQDWLEAEAEIDRILKQKPKPGATGGVSKQAFVEKFEDQLNEWDAKFDKLQAKVKKAKAEVRADLEKQLATLSAKRDAANAKMTELRERTDKTWEELKTGTEKTWKEMQQTLDRFVSRFK